MAKSPLLERVREAIRVRHYSIRTEHSYVQWVKRFILFHNKRPPAEIELPPLERTPQPNEESDDAQIQSAAKDVAIFE